MRRYELTDPQWAILEPFFPPTHSGRAGHPWSDHRPIVNGLLWLLHTGAAWRDLPERYGPFQTAHDRLTRWRADGTWNRIVEALLRQLDQAGRLDPDTWILDATILRATRDAAGALHRTRPRMVGSERTHLEEPPDHALGRSRGGFGTKIALTIEGRGLPVALGIQPGQEHESRAFETMMHRNTQRQRRGHRKWPRQLIADKGYSSNRIRQWLKGHRIRVVIPTKKNERPDPNFDRQAYRTRNRIERVIGWFKLHRRLATRYDKLAVNFLSFWTVAWITFLLKHLLPDTA
ncbi:MAG: IS5 family transposase [Gemmatimonadales bacterium]|nr:IS5 family transposase [Gemmatimonadales bacterium]